MMNCSNLTREQYIDLTRVVNLIYRNELDSAKEVVNRSKNFNEAEEVRKRIQDNIQDREGIKKRIQEKTQEQAIEILLFKKERINKTVKSLKNSNSSIHFQLPMDILEQILYYLDLPSIYHLSLVNRHFSKIPTNFDFIFQKRFPNPYAGYQTGLSENPLHNRFSIIEKNIKNNYNSINLFNLGNLHDMSWLTNFHVNNNILGVVLQNTPVKIFDVNTGKMLKEIDNQDSSVSENLFPRMNRIIKIEDNLLYLSNYNNICTYDIKNGKNAIKFFKGHKGQIFDMQIKEKSLYSTAGDYTVRIWDRETGKNCQSFEYKEKIYFTQIRINENLMYANSHLTGLVCISDLRSSKMAGELRWEDDRRAKTIEVVSNLFYLSMNGTSHILSYDIRQLSKPLKRFYTKNFHSKSMAVDGKYLFTDTSYYKKYSSFTKTKPWREYVSVFDRHDGNEQSRCIKKINGSPPIQARVLGAKESIQVLQMHRGELYIGSNYHIEEDGLVKRLTGAWPTMKKMNFNQEDDDSCTIS